MHPLGEILDRSVTEAAAVVRGVAPDRLGAPTPCADWDVRALANHLLHVVQALGLAGQGKPVPDELWAGDPVAGDLADRFDDEARAATEAWARDDAWDGAVSLGAAEVPAAMAATMLVSDLVIHGWDLARATGQPFRCEDDAAELAHRFLLETGEQGREMGIYAAAHPPEETASLLERALAASGRDPRWSPPHTTTTTQP